jgi:hypothetical protein
MTTRARWIPGEKAYSSPASTRIGFSAKHADARHEVTLSQRANQGETRRRGSGCSDAGRRRIARGSAFGLRFGCRDKV